MSVFAADEMMAVEASRRLADGTVCFVGIGLPEKEKLAKQMQKAYGVGGTVKEGRIEIQGDKRAEVAKILEEVGFRPQVHEKILLLNARRALRLT